MERRLATQEPDRKPLAWSALGRGARSGIVALPSRTVLAVRWAETALCMSSCFMRCSTMHGMPSGHAQEMTLRPGQEHACWAAHCRATRHLGRRYYWDRPRRDPDARPGRATAWGRPWRTPRGEESGESCPEHSWEPHPQVDANMSQLVEGAPAAKGQRAFVSVLIHAGIVQCYCRWCQPVSFVMPQCLAHGRFLWPRLALELYRATAL